ncbi:hypothetical protein RhiirA4_474894 [Rhizophagus irregularis]|uniref:Uncharacterized protein n=1 Tax=Rhizophagus irregularis TaxID=588596 RepID=A0A2I1H987_9GLOM|nr:hypothetical protein RhiirA4_474894 [Rhizophagus irregularis]
MPASKGVSFFGDLGLDLNMLIWYFRLQLGLGYADLASGSFSVELWMLASWTTSVGFLDVGFSVLFCRMVPCRRSVSWNELVSVN